MPNKEILLRYAELKVQAEKIAAEIELLKPAVLLEIEEIKFSNDTQEGVALAEYPDHYFTITPGRKSWTYSPEVTVMLERIEEEIKAEEKLRLQEGRGPATYVEGEKILKFGKLKTKK